MLFPATVGQPVCGGDRRERVMSIELTVLAWGCVLGVVQTYVAAELEGRQYGMKWALSSREAALPPPTPLVGRMKRAQANFLETFPIAARSEEHTSELQSLMRISYAVFCLKKKRGKQ